MQTASIHLNNLPALQNLEALACGLSSISSAAAACAADSSQPAREAHRID